MMRFENQTFPEDQDNLSKSAQKIVKTRQEKQRQEEEE